MERVYILGNMYPEPAAPFSLSLSVTHAVVMLFFAFFFFTNRCEATIMLIFSKVRRYSTHKHTLVPITASIKDESDGWEGNPFLGYCHPQCHWMNGRVVHLSRNATYPHLETKTCFDHSFPSPKVQPIIILIHEIFTNAKQCEYIV